MSDDQAYKNTDRELWREVPEGDPMSYYSPSIHVTERGSIGINVGGTVYVRTLSEWHALAQTETALLALRDLLNRWHDGREAPLRPVPYHGDPGDEQAGK